MQFGFRKNHSTVHPLVHFMNQMTNSLNKKHSTVAIFCDLQKAFDTVDYNILLSKLDAVGVRGNELLWFKNYLSDRKQFVSIENVNSSLLDIILGVPQGSILGPLLFLIYINDIQFYSNLDNSLFADDTTLLKSHENLETLANIVNSEFQKIVTFFRSHKLSLHPEKTKFMLFTNNRFEHLPEIFINYNDGDSTLNPIVPMSCINSQEKPYVKFLGVHFDPQLNFKFHISQISSKISKSLYYLRSAKNFLNQRSLKFIYYATFHAHLIYAIQIWSCTYESNIKSLFTKQKYAIRIISNARYNAHTEPLFKNLKILPLPSLCEFFKIQFMQSFVQGFLPSSFENMWTNNRIRRQDQAQIELRNDMQLHIPFNRTKSISLHPLIHFPTLWEAFPDEAIKFIRNKQEFNTSLKQHYLEKLSAVVACNRLYCPSCS